MFFFITMQTMRVNYYKCFGRFMIIYCSRKQTLHQGTIFNFFTFTCSAVRMQALEEAPRNMQCDNNFLIRSLIVSSGATKEDVEILVIIPTLISTSLFKVDTVFYFQPLGYILKPV